ncbi:hypothetical protein KME66_32275 [Streptomyces sp. YPW6]|uniref:hypothetical protein n=1 Tax=Streptomyces sp. YPW6 TaxID=2840373 RepID=UPI001C0D06F3|nr:hypothetical protein [Streptomyces sp. YPW6]QWQ45138.1 hypothetical protein KME66_32275 [Streptomyces sp. YPW6]
MSLPAGTEAPVTSAGRRGLSTAVQQHASLLVAEELRRLDRRTDLTSMERAEVAAALRRLASRLVLTPLAAWDGDPRVAAELHGLPAPRLIEGA